MTNTDHEEELALELFQKEVDQITILVSAVIFTISVGIMFIAVGVAYFSR